MFHLFFGKAVVHHPAIDVGREGWDIGWVWTNGDDVVGRQGGCSRGVKGANFVSRRAVGDSVLLVDDGDGRYIVNCSFDNITCHKVCCSLGTLGEGGIHELFVCVYTFTMCVDGGVIGRNLL